MVVQVANKLQDELLPELELSLVPCKLSDNIRVDLYKLSDEFVLFLIGRGHIKEGENNDTVIVPLSKLGNLCRNIRDSYCIFQEESR